jgi:hypothetical protein
MTLEMFQSEIWLSDAESGYLPADCHCRVFLRRHIRHTGERLKCFASDVVRPVRAR